VLDTPTLTKALVEAEANASVRNIKYAAPTADEAKITEIVKDEIGRIEAKMSILLMHIEGEYESKIANLELALKKQAPSKSFLGRIFK